jgi:Flp pilus assembly protein TadD
MGARKKRRSKAGAAAGKAAAGPTASPVLWMCLALVVATALVYAPVRSYDFVDFDDDVYVRNNPHVTEGLTVRGIRWALTTGHAVNWHPLTWLSHMMDVQLYGLSAGGHHVTNVLLHIASSLLLFGFFYRVTRAAGRGAFVAGVFALHPLHVESVAWVSERKDVLGGLFWMLTLWAYLEYVKRPRAGRYLLVVVIFALGLMAKPMLVTLPFVLLLLDVWPLERVTVSSAADEADDVLVDRLVFEKIPLLALAAAACIVTVLVQRGGPAFASLDAVPVRLRVENALTSYVAYIGKMLWPTHLAALYPFPRTLAASWLVVSIVILSGVSLVVIWAGRRRRYLAVGWLWYLVTLVPMIGLIQVGSQKMADRYTYVPLIGLTIMVAWGVPDLWSARALPRALLPAASLVVLLACAIAARTQVEAWRDTVTLWQHAIEVTTANPLAHNSLGAALERQGRIDEALAQYSAAARIHSVYYHGAEDASINVGNVLISRRDFAAAAAAFSDALRVNPNAPDAHNGLASALAQQGDIDGAIREYGEAVRREPDEPGFRYNLAGLLVRKGRVAEAIEHLEKGLAHDRGNVAVERALDDLKKARAGREGKDPPSAP